MTNMIGLIFQCRSETTDSKRFSVMLEKSPHYLSKTFKSTANRDPIFTMFETPVVPNLVNPEDSSNDVESLILKMM